MLQVKVTVLTYTDRRGYLQPLDLGLEATAPTRVEESEKQHTVDAIYMKDI